MPLNGGSVGSPQNLSNNQFFYVPFVWCITTLVKRATVWVGTAYTGGTTNMWGRLYDVAGSGTFIGGPGKLLYDFGLFGSSGTSLNSLGILQTGAAGNGFFLTPGDYYLCLGVGFTGGSGVPALRTTSLVHLGRLGSNMALNNDPGALAVPIAAGTPSGTPDDPAVTAGLGIWGFSCFGFALNSS
jgi:hypothetical protein